MTNPKHIGVLKLAAVIIAVLMAHSAAFSESAWLWYEVTSFNSGNSSSIVFPDSQSQQDDALQIDCPGNISIFTDFNTCSAEINNNLDVKIIGGTATSLTWEMTGATISTSLQKGINQIGSYV